MPGGKLFSATVYWSRELIRIAPDIAFTFDDGPYSYTSDLLDKMKVYNAKGTFFISKPSESSNEYVTDLLTSWK